MLIQIVLSMPYPLELPLLFNNKLTGKRLPGKLLNKQCLSNIVIYFFVDDLLVN